MNCRWKIQTMPNSSLVFSLMISEVPCFSGDYIKLYKGKLFQPSVHWLFILIQETLSKSWFCFGRQRDRCYKRRQCLWEGPDLRTGDVDQFLTVGCWLRVQDFKVYFLDKTRIPLAVPVCGRPKYGRIKGSIVIL